MNNLMECEISSSLKTWGGLQKQHLCFALLKHTIEPSDIHYDLLLQLNLENDLNSRNCLALQSSELPCTKQSRILWQTHGMHRYRNLTFEGRLEDQKGILRQLDSGYYKVMTNNRGLVIEIDGNIVYGTYEIQICSMEEHLWYCVNRKSTVKN